MSALPRIMVFDSGVGSLSITCEILSKIPHCYLACTVDNSYFPYGTKDDTELSNRIVEQVDRFHQIYGPDIVVIACNTASTLALETLRQHHSTPFVGVVPAVKPAAGRTKLGSIAVLATSATIGRSYTLDLIQDFASEHRVNLLGTDKLVHIAEQKIRGQAPNLAEIEDVLGALLIHPKDPADTLVLACTHFPILKNEISQIFQKHQRKVEILDSSIAIANRVHALLTGEFSLDAKRGGELHFLFSDEQKEAHLKAQYLRYIGATLGRW